MLVLGKVISGKLLDPQAEPLSYRQTGAMDGASALFPDVLDNLSLRSRSYLVPPMVGLERRFIVFGVVAGISC